MTGGRTTHVDLLPHPWVFLVPESKEGRKRADSAQGAQGQLLAFPQQSTQELHVVYPIDPDTEEARELKVDKA
eukprot:CAMPEP_0117675076 /NCGR_PEP_ID=MMETSP0804-20121206/15402_1 /TAXON_ID=1074897 /ORGANISM="Tetraselmis astigmatica, Strain CCMP880" /LENGTH=72 /DNA_ID=CAMNT_0005484035 /DNA_START=591 /DNA_END=810 /DNA_ORIENTATION=+